jgi:hypothetical protein
MGGCWFAAASLLLSSWLSVRCTNVIKPLISGKCKDNESIVRIHGKNCVSKRH